MITAIAGDKVIVYGIDDVPQLGVVERITPTMLIVAGARYNRQTGRNVGGDGWHFAHVEDVTDAGLARIESAKQKAHDKKTIGVLRQVNWSIVPAATREAVTSVLSTTMEYAKDKGWFVKEVK